MISGSVLGFAFGHKRREDFLQDPTNSEDGDGIFRLVETRYCFFN